MNNYYVYTHTNLLTGEVFYVGKGKDTRAYELWRRNNYWERYVNKHSYSIEIIKDCLNNGEACKLEIEYIKAYKALGEANCNFTKGGDGGDTYTNASPETKLKYFKGQSKGGKTHKGKIVTQETRDKISSSCKNRIPWNKSKPHSEETRKRISEACRGRTAWNKGVKNGVRQSDKERT